MWLVVLVSLKLNFSIDDYCIITSVQLGTIQVYICHAWWTSSPLANLEITAVVAATMVISGKFWVLGRAASLLHCNHRGAYLHCHHSQNALISFFGYKALSVSVVCSGMGMSRKERRVHFAGKRWLKWPFFLLSCFGEEKGHVNILVFFFFSWWLHYALV